MTLERSSQGPRPRAHRGRMSLALLVLVVSTGFAFRGALDNEFVNWDDPAYVSENPEVQQRRYGELLTAVVSGNYHPLTMLSLALDARAPLSPRPFHVTNVVLHIANSALVFWLILLLSGNRVAVAFMVALLFGIHPMHVESVAWVAERKDVLYAFFFLAAAIAYQRYLGDRRPAWLLGTFGLFVLSCLSKGMAVVFPLVMVLLDLWAGRSIRERRSLLEKIPFLAVALLFGLIALDVQKGGSFHGVLRLTERSTNALGAHTPGRPLDLVTLPSYGHMMYVWRLFVPAGLCAFNPYPDPAESGNARYMLAPFFVLLTMGLALHDARRSRIPAFGLGWYFVTIALVLQWLPVGAAIVSDRYTYLPYVGLLFVLAMGIARLSESHRLAGSLAWGGAALFAVWLGVQTSRQVEIWRNSDTLWTQVLHRYPRTEIAYINRGNYRGRSGRPQEALNDLRTARGLGSRKEELFQNLGNAFGTLGQLDSALAMYDQALRIDPRRGMVYYNRAMIHLHLGRPLQALNDLATASAVMPLRASILHGPRGEAYLRLGRHRAALSELDRAVVAGQGNAAVFYSRGVCRRELGDRAGARADFRETLRLDPGHAGARAGLAALGAVGS